MLLYINGSYIDTESGASRYPQDGGATFTIGAAQEGTEQYVDGLIDDVRVWSDIRSSSEIGDNYDTELTGSEGNLEGYWKFNNDATDETSNSNDLTNNSSATFATDVPF